mgnify:CR=1 FL=1|tara:strand:+ start:405 stop:1166 length:762 start_codon:yes stop_codon:yes gene_type:complete
MSDTSKRYTLEQVTNLLKFSTQNEKEKLVKLYPSQARMIENYKLALIQAEKDNFNSDVDYPSITPKRDKWRYGFIKSFVAETKEFEIQYNSTRFNWAGTMFESLYKRLDFDTISEWQSNALKTEKVQQEIEAMIGYYRPTGYFQSYIKIYDAGRNFSEEQYNKLCKNRYAVKVLEAHFAEPLFKVGEIVSLRGNNRGLESRGLHKGMFVLSNTEIITSARKGCKKYKLLPVGGSKPLFYEEYQLKKYKKPKKK